MIKKYYGEVLLILGVLIFISNFFLYKYIFTESGFVVYWTFSFLILFILSLTNIDNEISDFIFVIFFPALCSSVCIFLYIMLSEFFHGDFFANLYTFFFKI